MTKTKNPISTEHTLYALAVVPMAAYAAETSGICCDNLTWTYSVKTHRVGLRIIFQRLYGS